MTIEIKNITVLKLPATSIKVPIAVSLMIYKERQWTCIGEACLFRDGKAIKANIKFQNEFNYADAYPQPVLQRGTITAIRLMEQLTYPAPGIKPLKKYKQKSIAIKS